MGKGQHLIYVYHRMTVLEIAFEFSLTMFYEHVRFRLSEVLDSGFHTLALYAWHGMNNRIPVSPASGGQIQTLFGGTQFSLVYQTWGEADTFFSVAGGERWDLSPTVSEQITDKGSAPAAWMLWALACTSSWHKQRACASIPLKAYKGEKRKRLKLNTF